MLAVPAEYSSSVLIGMAIWLSLLGRQVKNLEARRLPRQNPTPPHLPNDKVSMTTGLACAQTYFAGDGHISH